MNRKQPPNQRMTLAGATQPCRIPAPRCRRTAGSGRRPPRMLCHMLSQAPPGTHSLTDALSTAYNYEEQLGRGTRP